MTRLAACLALIGCSLAALPVTSSAILILRPLTGNLISQAGAYSVDLDTDTEFFSPSYSTLPGHEFSFYTGVNGSPGSIFGGAFLTDLIFDSNSPFIDAVGLLGAGVTVDANLPATMNGSSFKSYGYFPAPTANGTHFIGFQTAADLDRNPLTLGTTYGFFHIEVGSLRVIGYGFESPVGDGAVTSPIPEPTTGALALLATGAVAAAHRRRRA